MPRTTGVVRLTADLVALVVVSVGLYGLVRRLNVAQRQQSQSRCLERLEATLAVEYGPTTPAAWARAARIRWPR